MNTFEIYREGRGLRARCDECGHVTPISGPQARGEEFIQCEECGRIGYGE